MADEQSKIQQLQGGVEEIKSVMLENINKAGEREDKLEELEDRAEELLERGKQFQKSTKRVKERTERENSCMSWKNKKLIAVIVGAVVLVLIIIILWATVGMKRT